MSCFHNHMKCSKYETCAKLHRFHIWYIFAAGHAINCLSSNPIQTLSLCIEILKCLTIGITHVFSCINIYRVPWTLFDHGEIRSSVQTSLSDLASVNAMKQTCVIVILAYFT